MFPIVDRYDMLHLHPLRSRVKDMEHKLKVAMDNLIRGVKLASSSRSPPGALCVCVYVQVNMYIHVCVQKLLGNQLRFYIQLIK